MNATPKSPAEETADAYLQAVAERDYRTARVCLLDVRNFRTVEDLIRRTHEMEPPR